MYANFHKSKPPKVKQSRIKSEPTATQILSPSRGLCPNPFQGNAVLSTPSVNNVHIHNYRTIIVFQFYYIYILLKLIKVNKMTNKTMHNRYLKIKQHNKFESREFIFYTAGEYSLSNLAQMMQNTYWAVVFICRWIRYFADWYNLCTVPS